jgi:hypothetical protein
VGVKVGVVHIAVVVVVEEGVEAVEGVVNKGEQG